jgi:hypothetical protein
MPDHDEPPAMLQLSLFPEAVEVQAAALAALRDLEIPQARKLLQRARRQNRRLVNLAILDAGLRHLESVMNGRSPVPAVLAEVVIATRDRCLAGELPIRPPSSWTRRSPATGSAAAPAPGSSTRRRRCIVAF